MIKQTKIHHLLLPGHLEQSANHLHPKMKSELQGSLPIIIIHIVILLYGFTFIMYIKFYKQSNLHCLTTALETDEEKKSNLDQGHRLLISVFKSKVFPPQIYAGDCKCSLCTDHHHTRPPPTRFIREQNSYTRFSIAEHFFSMLILVRFHTQFLIPW